MARSIYNELKFGLSTTTSIGLILGILTISSCKHNKEINPGSSAVSSVTTVCMTSADSAKISFNVTIAPIFKANCESCHYENGVYPNVIWTQANSAQYSDHLLAGITGVPGYQLMPPKGSGYELTDCEIKKITAWINNGKLNN